MGLKLLTLLICGVLASPSPAPDSYIAEPSTVFAVVVHVDSKIDNLSLQDLKRYMKLDRRHWPDKSPVILYQRPVSSDLQKYLFKNVYGMTERQLRRHFVSLMNKGSISAIPSVVKKKNMVCRLVGKKNGGIAVVVNEDLPKTVKVIKIDGKKPGEKGYPLVFVAKKGA
jgi:hypothetical protein